jgi:catechol 2,3-dioxygenase-like lactoylglutathione lyase family enzyme
MTPDPASAPNLTSGLRSKLKPAGLKGVHHSAFRCRDAEETRVFYEDILGLPLKAALVFEEEPGTGRACPYMHLFFQLGDGNFVAFFDVPDGADAQMFRKKWGMDLHFAIEAESHDDMMAYKERLETAGIACFGPIDHHFVHSIYFYDPNGINVEITYRDVRHDDILDKEAAEARQIIAAWSARTAGQKAANRIAPG